MVMGQGKGSGPAFEDAGQKGTDPLLDPVGMAVRYPFVSEVTPPLVVTEEEDGLGNPLQNPLLYEGMHVARAERGGF